MWTLSRNRASWVFWVTLIFSPVVSHATGGIGSLSIFESSTPPGPFTAGISTNSASSFGIRFGVSGTLGGVPDFGHVVVLELYKGSTPLPGGMSPSSFTTTGSHALYGGGASANVVPITFYVADTGLTIRATPLNSAVATQTSNPFTVVANTASKLVILAPGQTHDPGKDPNAGNTGRTGTPTSQEPSQPFTLTVLKTDDYFNLVATNGPSVTVTSGDLSTVTPASQSLSNGTASYTASIAIAKSVRTFTATPSAGLSIVTVDVPTSGPEREQVFPFPSPFNPHAGGRMTFRFQLNNDAGVKVIVKDQFGQDVWRNEVAGVRGPNDVYWDGRNEKSHLVAAGIYYALLEVNGEITSKKRFGVVK